MRETVTFSGKKCRNYTFEVYQLNEMFPAKPGVYCFAKLTNGRWQTIYLGETNNIESRLKYHHKDECIKSNGATHILLDIHDEDNDATRFAQEWDLLEANDFPCNGRS